jgi:hypothetical protein
MRRRLLTAIALVACLCLPAWPQERKVPEPVDFELRDFKFEVEERPHNVTYRGRGLLVARSPSIRGGDYFVFLKAKDRRTLETASDLVAVVMTNGEGELNISIFYGKSQRPSDVPDLIWEIVGYVPLLPARLSASPAR